MLNRNLPHGIILHIYVGREQEIDNLFTEIANTQEFEGVCYAIALILLSYLIFFHYIYYTNILIL